ncbi:MAG: DsrE family protein [Thermoplasmata archaeon]|jgi:predicted peroxiredoxin|nr:DsrE family protein [Thermoplasmata archaeon]
MAKRTDYSKKAFLVVGTHGEEDLEKATMVFACAGASTALGIRTKVFLTMNGVKLAQKGYAEKLKPVEGMASVKEMMDAFTQSGGKIQVCIPCMEARGISKAQFIGGVEFVNLMDFAAEAVDADRVFTC